MMSGEVIRRPGRICIAPDALQRIRGGSKVWILQRYCMLGGCPDSLKLLLCLVFLRCWSRGRRHKVVVYLLSLSMHT